MRQVPHPIPYQGSKRNLAPLIMQYANREIYTLYEPFAGSSAITIYSAVHNLARHFVIGDSLIELIELWSLIINKPECAIARYENIWYGQEKYNLDYFYKIREEYNSSRDPIMLLYLIARCVKNAVRFSTKGNFTQSVDKRRLGMHPDKMRRNILESSTILKGRVSFFKGDFKECIQNVSSHDLIYMDPPYQGTTYGRDKRYFRQLQREDLCHALHDLNSRNVAFLLSYDGFSGDKKYGEEMPEDLNMKRVFLNAGRSSQATLNGKTAITMESLYISKSLINSKEIDMHSAFENCRDNTLESQLSLSF